MTAASGINIAKPSIFEATSRTKFAAHCIIIVLPSQPFHILLIIFLQMRCT